MATTNYLLELQYILPSEEPELALRCFWSFLAWIMAGGKCIIDDTLHVWGSVYRWRT